MVVRKKGCCVFAISKKQRHAYNFAARKSQHLEGGPPPLGKREACPAWDPCPKIGNIDRALC